MLSSLLLTLTTLLSLTLLPTLTQAQSQSLAYPVIAHFSFDTASYTSQFNGYTTIAPSASPPTLVTSQSGASCPFGSCASFTDNHYLAITPWLPLIGSVEGAVLPSWGVGVWVKPDGGGWQPVLGEWGSGSYVWSLRLNNYQPMLIWLYRDSQNVTQRVELSASSTVSTSAWTHVAFSFNATSQLVTCWISGAITDTWQTTAVYSYLQGAPTQGWKVGVIDDVMYGLAGALDELWIFNKALTTTDVIFLRAINSIGTCQPGSAGYAQRGVGQCTQCEPGTYASGMGALVCSVCPAGTTTTGFGATGCTACAAGSFMATVGGQCQSCAAGYFAPVPGATTCLACPAGSYSAVGALSCSYCPDNTLSPAASTSAAACVACDNSGLGGAAIPVCCSRGVSASGRLLAATASALSTFNTANQCILRADVSQLPNIGGVLTEYCGAGYDTTLTSGLQAVYGDFNAFLSQADTTQLSAVFCNP